jgi:hypothetical protein
MTMSGEVTTVRLEMFVRVSPAQPLVWDYRFLGLERGKRGSVSAVGFAVFSNAGTCP